MSTKAKKPLTEKQRKKRIIIVASIVTVVLLVVGIVAAFLYSAWYNNRPALESDNYSVNKRMMTYYYFTDLYNTYENYGAYLPYMSPAQTTPDMTSSLSEQYYDYGTDSGTMQTWHEYFINQTISNVYGYLFYAEEALENDFEYADLDKEVDKYIDTLTQDAESIGLTLNEYIERNYGTSVKEADIRDALELQYFASKYMTKVQDDCKAALTEEDYEAYKEENIADLETVDYYSFTLGADVAEDATEEEKNTASTLASAQADDLLAKIEAAADMDAKTEAFTNWVTTYLTEDNKASEEPVTDEELATEIATQTAESTDKTRDDSSDFGAWAFDEEHVAGDAVKVETGTGIYTVFLLTSPCSIDESATKNVRHILITADTYGSDEEAKAKADEVLAEYNSGDKGADAFDAIAEKYNEDGSSFYENVTEGAMVTEFNDWLFDEAKAEGDTGVVKTTYGYHVMYFDGEGIPTWKADAAESLVQTKMEEKATELQEKYEDDIKYDNELLLEIPDHLPEAAFTSSADDTAADTTAETEAVEHDHDGDGVADHTDEEHVDETTADDTAAEETAADTAEETAA